MTKDDSHHHGDEKELVNTEDSRQPVVKRVANRNRSRTLYYWQMTDLLLAEEPSRTSLCHLTLQNHVRLLGETIFGDVFPGTCRGQRDL